MSTLSCNDDVATQAMKVVSRLLTVVFIMAVAFAGSGQQKPWEQVKLDSKENTRVVSDCGKY